VNKLKSLVVRAWNRAKGYVAGGVAVGLTAAAHATDPTSLSDVPAMGSGYLTTGQSVALGFAILGMGWAGYRVVRKYVK